MLFLAFWSLKREQNENCKKRENKLIRKQTRSLLSWWDARPSPQYAANQEPRRYELGTGTCLKPSIWRDERPNMGARLKLRRFVSILYYLILAKDLIYLPPKLKYPLAINNLSIHRSMPISWIKGSLWLLFFFQELIEFKLQKGNKGKKKKPKRKKNIQLTAIELSNPLPF